MPTTPNDFNVSLDDITRRSFTAYNAGGPPERANLTHDGRQVPPLAETSDSVRHKWACASSTAALAGAEYIIELVRVGQHDPAKLLASAREVLGAPPWETPAVPDASPR